MTPKDFEALADKVRNWGRWGPDDQCGTLNHISPEALMRGVAAAKVGKRFSLGLRFDRNGPQTGSGRRFNPLLYPTELFAPMGASTGGGKGGRSYYSDDVIHMPLQAATQWDALAHVHYDGVLYNGCKACDTLTVHGALRNGVEHMAEVGIMSRGVLLDFCRHRGVDELPIDYAISVDDLEAVCEAQGVQVEPGDVVLVRTGHIRCFTLRSDRKAFNGLQPGLSPACAEWLYERKVAAVGADNLAVEVLTAEMFASFMPLPFHQLALRDMGCPLGEMFNLERLAQDCADDNRYAFLFSAPPLAVTGAVGSPVNPLVLK